MIFFLYQHDLVDEIKNTATGLLFRDNLETIFWQGKMAVIIIEVN